MSLDAVDAGNPEASGETGSPRRFDRLSMIMALATVLLVGGTAWMRFGRRAELEPPTVGSLVPPLRLLDLETSEPLILVGLKGKIVWLVFWTSEAPSGEEALVRLEPVWKRFQAHRKFSLVTAAVDPNNAKNVRAALARAGATMPAYLAGPEMCRRLGVDRADPPLHILMDAQGRVAAMARGGSVGTIERLATQVEGWLEELDPLGGTRFARSRPGHRHFEGVGGSAVVTRPVSG
jgi:hypothetical protein